MQVGKCVGREGEEDSARVLTILGGNVDWVVAVLWISLVNHTFVGKCKFLKERKGAERVEKKDEK